MLRSWIKEKISDKFPGADFDILTPPDEKMGDYSTNLALVLAKKEGKNPMEIGEKLAADLSGDKDLKDIFGEIEAVKPGFINFKFSNDFLRNSLKDILQKGAEFGSSDSGKGIKINLEFVSANPTGPLTVGNARAASFGDTLGNILKKTGYEVSKEYYINDVGTQIKKLIESVRLRALELLGEKIELSPDLYQGDYIKDIARELLLDPEVNRDNIEAIARIFSLTAMRIKARKTMETLGISFDEWFSELKLHENGEIKETIKEIKNLTYNKDGAKWFKVSEFYPEEEDAVIVKSDGSISYLMGDIAYTRNKLNKRKFDKAINIWGADHHGDVKRLLAGAKALGLDGKLKILLHQLVLVKERSKLQRMSKREGKFILLDDLINDVGRDAVRFFFLTKDLGTHMEFDIDLARERSKENPVYYIQYAFARLSSIFSKAQSPESGIPDPEILKLIKEKEELELLRSMAKFPDLVEEIAKNYRVHHLPQYAFGLASSFHRFYEKHRVITEDAALQASRLALSKAVHNVLSISLALMGLSAPERM